MNNIKCEGRNGTYVCELIEGHSGTHRVVEKIRTARNEVKAIVTHAWEGPYSKVHSYRVGL